MSLQASRLESPQADAMIALRNMSQATQASENRVQRANDDVIHGLRTALEQSENNNQLLSEQNTRLHSRVTQLEQTTAQLEQLRSTEHQASEERFKALNAKIDALTRQLNSKTTEIETNIEVLRRRYNSHNHNIAGPCYAGHVIPTCYPLCPTEEDTRKQMQEEKKPKYDFQFSKSDKQFKGCAQQ